jgi:hypothetical protein
MKVNDRRTTVSLNNPAARKLRELQGAFERRIGFEPSLSQLVEYLINEYVSSNRDIMTAGQHVQPE